MSEERPKETDGRVLECGIHGAIARCARGLDAAHRSASESQEELAARVDRCAHELEVLAATLPEWSADERAEEMKRLRGRIDGLGTRSRGLRERVRKLHDGLSAMRRADLGALGERHPDLPERAKAFKSEGERAREATAASVGGLRAVLALGDRRSG